MNAPTFITIDSGLLRAQVSSLGAELVRLQDAASRDYLWDGDPAFWKGRAPLLFPMVGRAVADQITVDGRTWPMLQHGFARTSSFEIVDTATDHCTLTLRADAATLARYPFRFRLEVTYRLAMHELSIAAVVFNEGDVDMPASFGFHPAFRWPLPGSSDRAGHEIIFDRSEPEPIRRLAEGLLLPEPIETPVRDRRLALDDDLFRNDALVFDRIVSRGVDYRGPDRQPIRIAFPDMPQLGIWSKPGAGFVCIEPWQGFASPVGFAGEFRDKPGVVLIPPGGHRHFAMSVTVPG